MTSDTQKQTRVCQSLRPCACTQCGYRWRTRTEWPNQCPKCRSAKWWMTERLTATRRQLQIAALHLQREGDSMKRWTQQDAMRGHAEDSDLLRVRNEVADAFLAVSQDLNQTLSAERSAVNKTK